MSNHRTKREVSENRTALISQKSDVIRRYTQEGVSMAALCREFEVGSAWLRAQLAAWQVPRRIRKMITEQGTTTTAESPADSSAPQAGLPRPSVSNSQSNYQRNNVYPPVQRRTFTAPPAAALPHTSGGTLQPRTGEQPRPQQSWPLKADATAAPLTRTHLRTWLAGWDGNVDQAMRVASHLIENAVRHGTPLQPGNLVSLRVFGFSNSNDLAIEVEDALPDFPGFEAFAQQSGEVRGEPTGLWWVAHYLGRLSWDVTKDGNSRVVGKTVQALIPATWDGSA